MCSAASGGTGAVCVPVCVHAFVSSVGLGGGGLEVACAEREVGCEQR